MKIAHVADLHAGLVSHSTVDSATGLPSAIVSAAACWSSVVDAAIDHEVDAVIVAGDVFHDASPIAAAVALFARDLARLRAEGIPVVLIPGNHDRAPNPSQPGIVDAFDDRPRVFASSRPERIEVGDLVVATVPSVTRHALVASAADRWRSSGDQAVIDALRAIVAGFATGGADVLVGHWSVAGTILSSEADIAVIPEPMMTPGDLAGPWPYVAFGHIHRRQAFGVPDSSGAYAGSVDRINFGEERDRKGGWIVALDDPVAVTPFDTPARRFVTLDDDPEYWPGVDVKGAIVRVRGVEPERAAVVALDLGSRGADSVRVEAKRSPRPAPRDPEVTAAAATSPVDALVRWLSGRGVPDGEVDRYIDGALALIEGGS